MVLVAVVDAALANIDERWIGLPIGVFVALGVAAHEGQRGLSSELFCGMRALWVFYDLTCKTPDRAGGSPLTRSGGFCASQGLLALRKLYIFNFIPFHS